MPDNLNIRRPADPKRINVHEDWELKYWTRHFGVTADQLRAAVRAVGPMVANVERHFRGRS